MLPVHDVPQVKGSSKSGPVLGEALTVRWLATAMRDCAVAPEVAPTPRASASSAASAGLSR